MASNVEPQYIYYVSIQVDNEKSNETVILRWILPEAISDEKPIPGHSVVAHEFQIGAVDIPSPIEFQAHVKRTGNVVMLNGNEKLYVKPTMNKKTMFINLESEPVTGKGE